MTRLAQAVRPVTLDQHVVFSPSGNYLEFVLH